MWKVQQQPTHVDYNLSLSYSPPPLELGKSSTANQQEGGECEADSDWSDCGVRKMDTVQQPVSVNTIPFAEERIGNCSLQSGCLGTLKDH
jgi:hypothetical protein